MPVPPYALKRSIQSSVVEAHPDGHDVPWSRAGEGRYRLARYAVILRRHELRGAGLAAEWRVLEMVGIKLAELTSKQWRGEPTAPRRSLQSGLERSRLQSR